MATGPATERELLEGCRAGDPAAATEFVRRHQAPLLRTVLRLVGRRAVAEEIVQEALLETFRKIDRVDPDLGARRWLFRIAINLARKHRTRGAGARETAADIQEEAHVLFAAPEQDPEGHALSVEEWRRIARALDALPPKLREVALLRYVEGLEHAEVAAIVRLPIPAVRVRLFRARARLAALLREDPS